MLLLTKPPLLPTVAEVAWTATPVMLTLLPLQSARQQVHMSASTLAVS